MLEELADEAVDCDDAFDAEVLVGGRLRRCPWIGKEGGEDRLVGHEEGLTGFDAAVDEI